MINQKILIDRSIQIMDFPEITIQSDQEATISTIQKISDQDGILIYEFLFSAEEATIPKPVHLKWKMPALKIKGVWTSASLHEKRLQYDWELEHLSSRVSVQAPLTLVFDHTDNNIISFASSDAINKIEMNALLREEDVHLYCHMSMFVEKQQAIKQYVSQIRIDTRDVHFSKSLQETSAWWASYDQYKPASVPSLAKVPLYSTWYQFHQNLDETILMEECQIAASLGYELTIIDDGWQTMDSNRGYDYCGDWQPDRFSDLAGFVKKLHDVNMKVGIWFSVPFCGIKSKAYITFKGKFLTENHHWAPIFDPRYPEVRKHLINIYADALRSYNLDALKLDFIDEFRAYPETILTAEDGRDYANINEAVDRLMTDVLSELKSIKQDIAIEFRQKYIGPGMRKYGNMFRAFDCPNDPISNRIRTTDVKLLCGNTAVHSDMLCWHTQEKAEIVGLQFLNSLFSVPQLSIHLRHLSEDHLKMVKHYTQYWKDNAVLLLDGDFIAKNPLANYTVLKSSLDDKEIIAVYEDSIILLGDQLFSDVHNAKTSHYLVIKISSDLPNCNLEIFNCFGESISQTTISILKGIHEFEVPVSGMIAFSKID